MKPEVLFGLENAAWPALLVSGNGSIAMINAAASSLFGGATKGGSAQLAAIWATENGSLPAEFLAQWEKSPKAVADLKFKAAGGTVKNFPTAIAVLNDAGGKSFLLQLLPAAKSSELPTEFKNLPTGDAALKQKLDCVLQLARTVSLDFNNALTGVLAHTSLLLGKAEADHPWRRSLIEVEKSAQRAAEIAGELALFSRQEKETRRAPAGNLNTLMTQCVDSFRHAHGARFTWKLTPERALLQARFDEAKVQQALTKVLENAVESFAVGATGNIAVETRNVELTQATQDRNVRLAAGTYVYVEISDGGLGIEPDALPRIFEPFFTTKRPPHRGLGLALVYGIITNHGGGVAISSLPGKGTSARIYLPAEKSLVNDSDSNTDLRGAGTVLVVDDETILLTMAETILSDFGYKVLAANSGQKALQLLSQPGTKVDLVVTDLVMPGMGGRELIERIRQLGFDVPILCTSGYVMPEDKQGGAGYLQKPFTTMELLQKVKAGLASRKID